MPADQQRNDTLQWASLDDFTPGIISTSALATLGKATAAPNGAAQAVGTFDCIAIPGGGLAPLPSFTTIDGPTLPSDSVDSNGWAIVGFGVFSPVESSAAGSGSFDEIHVAFEWIDPTDTFRHYRWYRYRAYDATPTWELIHAYDNTSAVAITSYRASNFTYTRMTSGGDIANPTIATSWHDITQTSVNVDAYVWVFPDPAAPGTTGVGVLATTIYGIILAHTSRLALLTIENRQHGATASMTLSEPVNYTDPPLADAFPGSLPNEYFIPESPTGYGTFCPIDTGDLLLIKKYGGGGVVTGDVAAPTLISRYPAIQSTGQTEHIGANTNQGFMYLAHQRGAWLWAGSSFSQKVSQQLDDNFWNDTTPDIINGPNRQLASWADYVLFPTNWLLSLLTNPSTGIGYASSMGSFWKLSQQQSMNYNQYCVGGNPDVVYATWPYMQANGGPCFVQFTNNSTNLRPSWQWTGHPLRETVNRLTRIREIVITAMPGDGDLTGVVTVTCLSNKDDNNSQDGIAQLATMSLSSAATDQPTIMKFAFDILGYNIIPVIHASGNSTAPVVFSVQFGYQEGQLTNPS